MTLSESNISATERDRNEQFWIREEIKKLMKERSKVLIECNMLKELQKLIDQD